MKRLAIHRVPISGEQMSGFPTTEITNGAHD